MTKKSIILPILLCGMTLFFISKDVKAKICMFDGECDDGNMCTEDWCDLPPFGFGTCKYSPVDCDDGIECTEDSCVDGIGCINSPQDDLCGIRNECEEGLCDVDWGCLYTPYDHYCSDGNPCTGDICKGGEGCIYEIYFTHPCDDGLFCNGTDTCDEVGSCSVHSGDPCSSVTFCNEATDSCDATPPSTSTTTTSKQTTSTTTSTIQPTTSTTSQPPTDTYSVSGYVIGEISEGVLILLAGTTSKTCTTDIHGLYEFTDLYSGYYTITPKMDGYSFEPPNYVIQNLSSDLYDMDFDATKISCLAEEIFDENSEEIELLRYLRGEILSQTPVGQEIIELYYQWSPVIVKAMEEDKEFKEEVKEMIDGVLELIEGEVEAE